MEARTSLSGEVFRQFVESGFRCLEEHVEAINALNVFPVPDGDTGTNMLLTLRDGISAPELPPRGLGTVAEVSHAVYRGALHGARGNSGVIFSQFLKGLASGLKECPECDGPAMQRSLAEAAEAAYQAVGVPVEGTMLTVMRAAAQGAESVSMALPQVWEAAYEAAEEALVHTPDQLAVLREAGVVDAGGQGVVAFMAGAMAFLNGQERADLKIAVPTGTEASMRGPGVRHEYLEHTEEELYGYCTQFVVQGHDLDVDQLRAQVGAIAISTVVVGDETMARVHAHAADPGPLLSLGAEIGSLDQIKIENMDTMHQEFMAQQGYMPAGVSVAVVAVALGDGLEQVFRELGAAAVVRGGQTMNPSAGELLEAVKRTLALHVVLLPNNPNILMAARQAAELSLVRCTVVASRSVPEGIASILALSPDLDAEANVEAMTAALADVRSGEVTTSVRDTTMKGVAVGKGHAIGLLGGELVAVADTPHEALLGLLGGAEVSDGSLVTLYWGGDTDQAAAAAAVEMVRERWPGVEVELVAGGQPHYHYLVSIE